MARKKAMKAKITENSDDGAIDDERFIAAETRPQFKTGRKFKKDKSKSRADDNDHADRGSLHARSSKTKAFEETFGDSLTAAIQSDSRFAEALTNQDKFGCVPLMDKYGRKSKKKTKKSYEDNHVDAFEDDVQEDQSKEKEPDNQENNGMESRIAYLNALSRGEISASSSDDDSSDDSSVEKASDANSDDDSSASIDVYGKAGVFDPSYNQLPGDAQDGGEGIELTDSPTPYLAILNLDWRNIGAVDIYAMLQSFCPPGTLTKVDVYPSDFGLKMMEKEKVQGPSGIWKKHKKKSRSDASELDDRSDDPEDSERNSVDNVDSVDGNQSEASADGEYDQEGVSDDDAEDIMNLNEATAKLYSHFPPQSEVTKKSRNGDGEDSDEEGFDREKLRAYEASKLRYYFAIATFSSPGAVEQVYNDVDGLEMEHSAAEIDVRVLPADEYNDTIEGRSLRDTCNYLPGKYSPPDAVVAALRQSRVSCSWETGDAQRDKKLTQWGMGKDAWHAMAEGDDIKFYLASDHSSADEEGDSESEQEARGCKQTKQKATNMRSLLGLADSDDDDIVDINSADNVSSSEETESSGQNEPSTKKMIFTPGKDGLEKKIRSKINNAEEETEELTPFQKYLEKRKQKRRERKAAARNKKRDDAPEDDGMYAHDAGFGMAKFSDEESGEEEDETDYRQDDFFLEKNGNNKKGKKDKRDGKDHQESDAKAGQTSTKEELELLIAGDEDEEQIKDYDMRGLAKLERHAGKKLKGKRKRQMETLAANVSGQEFQVDTSDDRFAALLDGTDDRFGIDRTNPMFKETGAMKTLIEEQTKRRKKSRGKRQNEMPSKQIEVGNTTITGTSDELVDKSGGAMALSSLVRSLQQKVRH